MTFNRQKLERLRAKFGDAGGNEIFDPHFRAVADSVFKDSDKRPPPYAGVPTLLRAPFRPDFTVAMQDKIDMALLGVPMDLGVTNRSSARFGPRPTSPSTSTVWIPPSRPALERRKWAA
jgi:agmatinase